MRFKVSNWIQTIFRHLRGFYADFHGFYLTKSWRYRDCALILGEYSGVYIQPHAMRFHDTGFIQDQKNRISNQGVHIKGLPPLEFKMFHWAWTQFLSQGNIFDR